MRQLIVEDEGVPRLASTATAPVSLSLPVTFPPSGSTSAFSLPRPTCEPVKFPLNAESGEVACWQYCFFVFFLFFFCFFF
jgi:hypothetical protein